MSWYELAAGISIGGGIVGILYGLYVRDLYQFIENEKKLNKIGMDEAETILETIKALVIFQQEAHKFQRIIAALAEMVIMRHDGQDIRTNPTLDNILAETVIGEYEGQEKTVGQSLKDRDKLLPDEDDIVYPLIVACYAREINIKPFRETYNQLSYLFRKCSAIGKYDEKMEEIDHSIFQLEEELESSFNIWGRLMDSDAADIERIIQEIREIKSKNGSFDNVENFENDVKIRKLTNDAIKILAKKIRMGE